MRDIKIKRKQILQKISEMFYERGYEKTSIRDISKNLGVSNAGLYYYFKNKQQMLFEVINGTIEPALIELRERIKTIQDPEDRISWIIQSHIRFYVEHKAQTKVAIHERNSLKGEYAEIIRGKETEYVNFMRNVLKEIIKKFAIKIDVNIVTFCLLGMLNWVVHWYNPEGRVSHNKLAQNMSTIFLNGLKGKTC